MFNCLINITGNNNIIEIIKALHLAINKIFVLDNLDNTLSYYRAREINHGHRKSLSERH